MVEVYNFENLIKIQVEMSFGSDSAKLLLKDDSGALQRPEGLQSGAP